VTFVSNQSLSLLFLTLQTLDLESEHVFESYKYLQSTADMMPAFISGVKGDDRASLRSL
jgi:hypothetical protein